MRATQFLWRRRLAILIAVVDLLFVAPEIRNWRLPQSLRGDRWFDLHQFGGTSFGTAADPMTVALATSQTALLAIWACFGRKRSALRWLGATSGTCLWIAALRAVATGVYHPSRIEILLLTQWLVIAMFSLAVRTLGYRVSNAGRAEPSNEQIRPAQFSIIDLFWVTAAVALILGVAPSLQLVDTFDELRRVFTRGPTNAFWAKGTFITLVAYGCVCGASSLLALWAAWGIGRSWLRLLIVGALVWASGRIGISLVMIHRIHGLAQISFYLVEPRAYLLWFCAHGGIVFGALVAIRTHGCWLMRRNSTPTAIDAGAAINGKLQPRLRTAAWLTFAVLIAVAAWFFDDLSAHIFGDDAYRRAIGAVMAKDDRNAVVPFADFVGVWLRRSLTGEDFEYYRQYPAIAGFNFDDGPIDDATWNELKRWPQLRFLGLGNRTTDKDLERLAEMPDLEVIWLHSPGVTDAGLIHLQGLKKLQVVQTENSPNITDAGVKQLTKSLPQTLFPRRP